jgi:DNA-binding NarL/FixJ family response regulator
MNEQIQIGIAEDHDVVREGLVSLLKEQDGIKVLFDVSNGKELLEKLKTTKPDIILLDLEMPVISGKEAFEKIKQRYPKIKVIVLSAFSQDRYILEYIKKGVAAFLPKNYKIDKIVDAIYQVHSEGTYFDKHVSMLMAKELSEPKVLPENSENKDSDLSEREKTIIRYVCQNKTSEDIGDLLSLSKKAIDYHRSKIMAKTKSGSLADLVTYALKHKIISIE